MLSTRPAPVEAPARQSASLFSRLAWGALLALLLLAPLELSGFWATTYDFWPQAIWLLLSAGATLLLAISPDARPRFEAVSLLILAFLAWNGLAIWGAVYRHDAGLEWARLLGVFVPFFAIRALWSEALGSEKRAIWLILAWTLGVTANCVPALWDFAHTHYPRQAGPFFNTNLFANALAMALPAALMLPVLVARLTPNRALRIAALAPFLLGAPGLIVTSSKGGFLAFLVGILVTTGWVWRAKAPQLRIFARRNRAILTGATLVLLLGFGAIGQKTILPRLQAARGSDDNSTMFRAYIWRATLDMARERPLLGFGPGGFPHAYPRFAQVSYTRSAHQSWLQIASEGGLPALLLLLGAIVLALGKGWKRLQTRDWPLVAGAAGSVAAMLVHGSVDAGWQTTSIGITLAITLALLVGNEEKSPLPAAKSRLNPFWIGATLLLAWGGNLTQRAASGENARAQSETWLKNGAPGVAEQKLREATGLDPTSARLWSYLGRLQESLGEDGSAALQTAAALQPTRPANWANLARVATREGNPAQAEKFYARALALAPRDTHQLLDRAKFRLDTKNGAGYSDLETILALKTQPYGKYEPVEQLVNLDFARATLLLSPELKRRGAKARLGSLIQSALADCARARRFAAQNEEMQRETGTENENEDLETLSAGLQALQTGR